jgi:hypothetical protein
MLLSRLSEIEPLRLSSVAARRPEVAMPACISRVAVRRQIMNVVGFAFAAGAFLMQAAVNWVRGERLLTALYLLSLAWLAFGIVVVSRRILKAVP